MCSIGHSTPLQHEVLPLIYSAAFELNGMDLFESSKIHTEFVCKFYCASHQPIAASIYLAKIGSFARGAIL